MKYYIKFINMKKKLIGILVAILIISIYFINKYKLEFEVGILVAKSMFSICIKGRNCKKNKKKQKIIKNICNNVFNLCNVKLQIEGKPINNQAVLFVSNHHSYLDSLILRSLITNVYTIAKSETFDSFKILNGFTKAITEMWGVIEYKRGNKKSGIKVRKIIKDTIDNGKSVLVYPEGGAVAIGGPSFFYPGSFEVAYENNFIIQPITLKYYTDVTWGKEHNLSQSHHLNIMSNIKKMKQQKNKVSVIFHEPINPNKFVNAEHLKNYCHYKIVDKWIDLTLN